MSKKAEKPKDQASEVPALPPAVASDEMHDIIEDTLQNIGTYIEYGMFPDIFEELHGERLRNIGIDIGDTATLSWQEITDKLKTTLRMIESESYSSILH